MFIVFSISNEYFTNIANGYYTNLSTIPPHKETQHNLNTVYSPDYPYNVASNIHTDEKLMKQTNPAIAKFFTTIKPHQEVWGLQDHTGEEWVVCDSVNFEDTDAMPLWSSKELAQVHCSDEWKSYKPAAISVSDLLEFWIEDLNEDNIVIGLDWENEGECAELELAEFTQSVVDIETL